VEALGDLAVRGVARYRGEHDAGAQGKRLRRLRAARPALQRERSASLTVIGTACGAGMAASRMGAHPTPHYPRLTGQLLPTPTTNYNGRSCAGHGGADHEGEGST